MAESIFDRMARNAREKGEAAKKEETPEEKRKREREEREAKQRARGELRDNTYHQQNPSGDSSLGATLKRIFGK